MEEKERYRFFETAIQDTEYQNTDVPQSLMDKTLCCIRLNEQDARIKELEEENQQLKQQLAESEKNFIIANNLRKNSNEVLLNYKTEKYGLDKTIQELRKMKLSLPEKEWYYKGFENCERQMSSHIADLTLEVKQLKQQLHDLPKKIVGEIRDISGEYFDFNICKECGNIPVLNTLTTKDFNEILDTILKKFGGEDESK